MSGFYLNRQNNNSNPKEDNKSLLVASSTNPQLSTASSISSGVGSNSNGTGSTSDMNYTDSIENELIIYDIENWICGAQEIFIRLENEFGEEKASFRKTN